MGVHPALGLKGIPGVTSAGDLHQIAGGLDRLDLWPVGG